MENVIDVKNLHVSYNGNEVLHNVSFSFGPGKLVGIIGPNGAGKSTMIKSILKLIRKDQGDVKIFGKDIEASRNVVAYVPQRSNIDWDFPISVIDTVLLGTYPKLGLFHKPKQAERDYAHECLERVGMLEFKNKQIGQLSGGQQQRVFLARALAQRAELYFLDEPFVGIDVSSEQTIIAILNELRDEGKTIFVVHHDLSKVEAYFDDLILVNKELIDAGPVKDVFTKEVMDRAYDRNSTYATPQGGLVYGTH